MVSNLNSSQVQVPQFAATQRTPALRNGMPSGRVAKSDSFQPVNGKATTASPKFAGAGKAIGGFALSAAICWPLAVGAALLGILIHPLLPIAALLGAAPFVAGAIGAFWGSGKHK